MSQFRTLDHADLNNKRVLLRVDLNVPMENGKVTDADPHRARRADHHRNRRQGRQGDPARAFRPAQGPRPEGIAASPSRRLVARAQAAGRLSPTTASAQTRKDRGRRDEAGRHSGSGKHALPQGRGKERSGFRRSSSPTLGDIYVNDAFSAAHRAHASTEGLGHKLPAYAGRTMQAELDALAKALDAPKRSR